MEQNTHAFTFLLFLAAINGCAGLTLFPEPAGPFYGFPYSTNVARRFPIPSSAYGKCQVRNRLAFLSTITIITSFNLLNMRELLFTNPKYDFCLNGIYGNYYGLREMFIIFLGRQIIHDKLI